MVGKKTMAEKNNEKEVPVGKVIALLFFALVGSIALFGSFYVMDAGQEGVVLTWGKPSATSVGPGLHFKWPIAQKIVKYDVQTLKYEADAAAASKDLQDVSTKIAVNFHIDPSSVPTLHREIGKNYGNKLIMPSVQDSVKAATAYYTAEELITKRAIVREQILVSLRERLNARGIIVEDISITNFVFSSAFNAAIEAKVTTEQNALTEQNRLKTIEFQAQQAVAKANGDRDAAIATAEGQAMAIKLTAEAEAEKIRLQNQELSKSPQYVELIKWQRWDGALPQWYMVGENDNQLLMQVPQPGATQ